MLRGARLGKFTVHGWSADLLESEMGRRYGLSSERHRAFPLLDQLIWNWVLYNEKIIGDLADLPTARVVRHQDLVQDPLTQFSELFAFAGLSWTQTPMNSATATQAPSHLGFCQPARQPAGDRRP
jgi:hypothetical protein